MKNQKATAHDDPKIAADTRDNRESAVEAITAEINTRLANARGASRESLEQFRIIGSELRRAKDILQHGEYLTWAKTNFNFSKQWCSQLTKLAASWSDHEKARSWAAKQDIPLGGNEYSVDGALALIRNYQRSLNQKPRLSSAKRQTMAELKAENSELRMKLEEARLEIHRLQSQAKASRSSTGLSAPLLRNPVFGGSTSTASLLSFLNPRHPNADRDPIIGDDWAKNLKTPQIESRLPRERGAKVQWTGPSGALQRLK